MFSLIAQTFLPSFHSVEGVDIFIAGASPKSKAKANYGTRCARGVSRATAKAEKRFFGGSRVEYRLFTRRHSFCKIFNYLDIFKNHDSKSRLSVSLTISINSGFSAKSVANS